MSFSIGSSVTTQVCPTRARTRPVDLEAAAALRGHVERGTRGENFAQAAHLRHGLAHGLVGLDVAMQSGLGDLRHGDGNAPGIGLVGHVGRSAHGSPFMASRRRRWRGNFHDPRSSVASSSRARSAMAASA